MRGESRKKENDCIILLPRFLPAIPFFLTMAQQPPMGQGLLIIKDSCMAQQPPVGQGLLIIEDS